MDMRETRLVTLSEAEKLGIALPESAECACEFCGASLEPLGFYDGEHVFWIGHTECDCPEKREHEELERKRQEQIKAAELEQKVLSCGIGKRYARAEVCLDASSRYLEGFEGSGGRGLYITGPVGSGKTYAASALARAFVTAGYRVIFTTSLRMLDEIRASYEGSREGGLGRYARCDVLIIDDIGKENANAWALTTLFQVLNDRYEAMLPTIYTSQYSLDALTRRMARGGERESAEAICSRIRQTSQTVRLAARDRRREGQIKS